MILLVGNTKGGVGKSMITVNIATALAHRGKSVLLIDADRQPTCFKWSGVRVAEQISPEIPAAPLLVEPDDANASVFRAKIQALAEKFDMLVIDSGGRDSRELRAAMSVADIVLVPCQPSAADVWELSEIDDRAANILAVRPEVRFITILNRCPPLNFHDAITQAREAMQKGIENLHYTGLSITDRPTFRAAFQDGRGIVDLERNERIDKARAEIEAIIDQIL